VIGLTYAVTTAGVRLTPNKKTTNPTNYVPRSFCLDIVTSFLNLKCPNFIRPPRRDLVKKTTPLWKKWDLLSPGHTCLFGNNDQMTNFEASYKKVRILSRHLIRLPPLLFIFSYDFRGLSRPGGEVLRAGQTVGAYLSAPLHFSSAKREHKKHISLLQRRK
jgi:hypothetical protein